VTAGLDRLITASRGPFPGNVMLVARALLGRPYCKHPLGEGDGVDPSPRLRTDCFDCVTFVETCLAVSLSHTVEDVIDMMDRIRYRKGAVGFATRNHFIGAEWLPHNAWLLEEGTPTTGPNARIYHEKMIDRERFLRLHGYEGSLEGPARIEAALPYLQRESWLHSPPAIGGVAVTAVIRDHPDVEVTHMGLLCGSPPVMIHASSVLSSVVEQSPQDYLTRNPNALGLTIWKLRPEAATTPPS
jgi:hypothetical protein